MTPEGGGVGKTCGVLITLSDIRPHLLFLPSARLTLVELRLGWCPRPRPRPRQSWFMDQDLDMYHEESDTPSRVRTMNLNEDLGQVGAKG